MIYSESSPWEFEGLMTVFGRHKINFLSFHFIKPTEVETTLKVKQR